MILRRVIEHFRKQEWTAIFIDFVIVVVGVFIGVQVSNLNEAAAQQRRTAILIDALRQDLLDSIDVEERFISEVDAGLAAFDEARARGEKPPPFYFRVSGSDTPPAYIWQASLQSRLGELVHPSLLFDLGFFYSENDGIGVKYVRYATFVEQEILPRLNEDPSVFYDERGSLRPEFAANIDRLREWRSFIQSAVRSAKCLEERFAEPTQPGRSCRLDYDDATNAGAGEAETTP